MNVNPNCEECYGYGYGFSGNSKLRNSSSRKLETFDLVTSPGIPNMFPGSNSSKVPVHSADVPRIAIFQSQHFIDVVVHTMHRFQDDDVHHIVL